MPRFASSPRVRRNFAAAHFSKSLAWSFVDVLQAYFLHVVLGLSAFDTGRVLVVLLSFGACWNVVIGALVDLRCASPARVLRLHLIGAVLTALAIFTQFSVGNGMLELIATGLVFRFSFALYDVPQSALTSLLPADEPDARAYIQLRSSLSALARFAVAAANLALGELPTRIFRAGLNWALAGITVLIVLTAATLLLAAPGDRERRPAPSAALRLALPKGALTLLLCLALSVTLLPIMSRLLVFTPAEPSFPHRGAWLLLAYTLGNVVGPFAVMPLESRFGWRAVWLSSMTLGIVSGDALAALVGNSAAVALLLSLAHGIGLGFVGALEWEAASRLVRRHADATGQRTDGLMFGLVVFVIQISVALASMILGALLEGFVRGDVIAMSVEIATITLSGAAITPLMASGLVGLGVARLDTDAAQQGGTTNVAPPAHTIADAAWSHRDPREIG